jgi:hypothetical protein
VRDCEAELLAYSGALQPHGGLLCLDEVPDQSGWRRVIKAACQQMSVWKLSGVTYPTVAVNVAYSQLDAGVADYVQRTLALFGLTAHCLETELTEGALERGSEVAPVLKQLREMGVTLSIDDSGTGYSSLGHLKNSRSAVSKSIKASWKYSGCCHREDDPDTGREPERRRGG